MSIGRDVKNYWGIGIRIEKPGNRGVGSGSDCKKPKTGDPNFSLDFWHQVIIEKPELGIYIYPVPVAQNQELGYPGFGP